MVQLLQFTWACRSRWMEGSAVATIVWSTEAIISAIETTAKMTARRGVRLLRDLLRRGAGVRNLFCHDAPTYTACRQATSWRRRYALAMDDDGAIRLRRVIGKLARQLNASSTGAGLTPSQASVLGLIVARGPMSLADLGELEGLNPTMLSRVIGGCRRCS